jgi:sporulation protein YlmC with PRC-barrel domain
MAHFGTLRNYSFADAATAADDIRGATLYGRKGSKLGKIDDVIFDHASGAIRYVVVDTGGWLSSKKFIIPPQQLRSASEHPHDFSVNLDKQEIESFPPYDESAIASQANWKDYENRYQESWVSGAVQHREGSDHNVTPTASEMPEQPGSIGSQISPEMNRSLTNDRIIPAGADEVKISNSGAGLGPRWSTFEERLRQHRKEVTGNCEACEPQSVSPGEQPTIRKAS